MHGRKGRRLARPWMKKRISDGGMGSMKVDAGLDANSLSNTQAFPGWSTNKRKLFDTFVTVL